MRRVVFQHSTREHVSLYRPKSEIYVQENIFVVSFRFVSFRFVTSRPLCQIKQGNQTTIVYLNLLKLNETEFVIVEMQIKKRFKIPILIQQSPAVINYFYIVMSIN